MTKPKPPGTPRKKGTGGARAGAGRKPHKPTDQQRAQVEALSGYGIPMDQISALVGVDEKTMRAHYDKELARGRAIANSQVAKTLFEKATKGNDTTAMIWWTKARMGWSEKTTVAIGGASDLPPVQVSKLNVSALSTEALAEIMKARDAAG